MSIVRDVYLSEFKDMIYKERLCYLIFNELTVDWEIFKVPLNPMYWCFAHLLKTIYLPVLLLLIYPFLLFPAALYEAHKLKSRYSDREQQGWFKSNMRVLK